MAICKRSQLQAFSTLLYVIRVQLYSNLLGVVWRSNWNPKNGFWETVFLFLMAIFREFHIPYICFQGPYLDVPLSSYVVVFRGIHLYEKQQHTSWVDDSNFTIIPATYRRTCHNSPCSTPNLGYTGNIRKPFNSINVSNFSVHSLDSLASISWRFTGFPSFMDPTTTAGLQQGCGQPPLVEAANHRVLHDDVGLQKGQR